MIMMSPDGRPIIDHVPSVHGLYVMLGDSGTSFKTSPAIGKCLAEWIVNGQARTVDLWPFRSTRFAEGTPGSTRTTTADAGLFLATFIGVMGGLGGPPSPRSGRPGKPGAPLVTRSLLGPRRPPKPPNVRGAPGSGHPSAHASSGPGFMAER